MCSTGRGRAGVGASARSRRKRNRRSSRKRGAGARPRPGTRRAGLGAGPQRRRTRSRDSAPSALYSSRNRRRPEPGRGTRRRWPQITRPLSTLYRVSERAVAGPGRGGRPRRWPAAGGRGTGRRHPASCTRHVFATGGALGAGRLGVRVDARSTYLVRRRLVVLERRSAAAYHREVYPLRQSAHSPFDPKG